jgi:hypothetical protein
LGYFWFFGCFLGFFWFLGTFGARRPSIYWVSIGPQNTQMRPTRSIRPQVFPDRLGQKKYPALAVWVVLGLFEVSFESTLGFSDVWGLVRPQWSPKWQREGYWTSIARSIARVSWLGLVCAFRGWFWLALAFLGVFGCFLGFFLVWGYFRS